MKRLVSLITVIFFQASIVAFAANEPPLPPPGGVAPQAQEPQDPGIAPDNPQPQDPQQLQQSQPGVGRVSFIHGDVSTLRGDTGDWGATTLNAPLAPNDQVATGDRSSTELQLDYANVLRLSDRTQAKIADLRQKNIQIQVSKGLVDYTVFNGNEANVEIDTPNVAVRLTQPGTYRIEVLSDSETEVITRRGAADIVTPQGSTRLNQGQLITVRGTDDPEYQVAEAPASDGWDQWNDKRDHTIENAESWRNANRYYTGTQDLDAYGRWQNVPGYGQVWAPAEPPDWAPYRAGQWIWEPYYGWTWVSNEPWGWAPYHYGRWFMYDSAWMWWPGPIDPAYRPLWAPAYVSFFGFGHGGFGVNVGFGFGSIGWMPIGPFDAFHPWYGRGFGNTYVTNINNITNVRNFGGGAVISPLGVRGRQPEFSNLQAAMTNERVRSGMTTVAAGDFGRGVAGRGFAGNDVNAFRGGRALSGSLPVVPSRESLRPGNASLSGRTSFVGSTAQQHFFSVRQPQTRSVPFSEQARQVQHSVEQHSVETGGRMNGAMMAQNSNQGVAGGSGQTSRGSEWNTMGTSQGSRPAAQRPSLPSSSDWHSFAGQQAGSGSAGRFEGNTQGRFQTTQSTGATAGRPAPQGNAGGWQRFGQSGGANAGASRSMPAAGARPPLNLSKPILTRRDPGYAGNGGPGAYSGNRGYQSGGPAYSQAQPRGYNGPSGNYASPRNYSQPSGRGYSAPQSSSGSGYAGSRGGGFSAPSGGGRGFGGGNARASLGGGEHGGSGGGSRPRGR